jgi:hypothetical protein
LDYSIQSYLPYVDNVVIVEGAYQETIALGKSPRSTDGTLSIIEKYLGHPKVDAIQANEQSDKDQRNIGLNKLRALGCDWLLIIDGDEVYTKQSLDLIKNLCSVYDKQDIKAAYFQSITFVNDMEHYCTQFFPRLFKITSNSKFINDNFMQWGNINWQYPHVINQHTVKYFHYSFLKSIERFNLKRDWWMNRGLGDEFDYGWKVDQNGKISDLKHKIYLYTGSHPDIVKTHPLWKNNG